jgi:hypothetical protein
VGLGLSWALAGLALMLAGLLMVTDYLSLRGLLARTGPEAAQRVVLGLHVSIEHSGAQLVELAGALVGAALIVLSIRTLRGMGS